MIFYRRNEWYGEVFDLVALTGPKKADRVALGRHDSKEAMQAAYEHWVKTGEKPAKRFSKRKTGTRLRVVQVGSRFHAKSAFRKDGRCRYVHVGTFGTREEAVAALEAYRETGERKLGNRPVKARKERSAVVRPAKPQKVRTPPRERRKREPNPKKVKVRKTSVNVAETRVGKRFYLSGREYVNGRSTRVFVGTFNTEKEVEEARQKFIATGWRAPVRKRGPIRVEDIKILPGRNLRDQEVDVLKRFRPELMGGDPRARREEETVAEWAKRLAVMKGFIAA